ncbi:MAG: hypothetical protein WAN60_11485, partial [Candidatus Sulfotelmatobacter sp.]
MISSSFEQKSGFPRGVNSPFANTRSIQASGQQSTEAVDDASSAEFDEWHVFGFTGFEAYRRSRCNIE